MRAGWLAGWWRALLAAQSRQCEARARQEALVSTAFNLTREGAAPDQALRDAVELSRL